MVHLQPHWKGESMHRCAILSALSINDTRTRFGGSLTAMLAALVLVTASAGQADAAAISWETGPTYNGASGFLAISTKGILVEAVNADDPNTVGNLTVDPGGINITFTPDNTKLPNSIFSSGSPGTTDANWNTIVDQTDWSSNNGVVNNFLTGLEVGKVYQLQLFASDARGCCGSRVQFFSDGQGNNSPSFTQNTFTSIIGTFTADATTQDLGLFANPGSDPILEAYVLRAIPEPTSAVLCLIGVAGLTARRRRQRRDPTPHGVNLRAPSAR